MKIEELILDGFKSYPVRTQITGWDSSFNAITGLNGSGKSNILDAICFVLGITNMGQLRAQNHTDLIYKRGQAGDVTKASVTIVFDNTDEAQRPEGHPEPQITVTRQVSTGASGNKYLLNGHKVPQDRIHRMFQSVQLNINAPNFLIMQGRITKVLNMKAPEILGMIEEAAGTRMFEKQKEEAKKTMQKKVKRVDEITTQIAEEINPKLDKLRSEKRAYITYQKTCTELDRVERVMSAFDWQEGNAKIKRKQLEMDEAAQSVIHQNELKKKCARDMKSAEDEKEQVKRNQEAEMQKGGKLKKYEEEVAELAKKLSKIRTQGDIKSDSIKDERSKIATLEAGLQDHDGSLAAKRAELEQLSTEYKTVKDKHDGSEAAIVTAEDLLQTLLTGLTSSGAGNASGGGYMGQLAQAKAQLAQATAQEKQDRVKLAMHEKDLKELEARWKQVEREAGDSKRNLQQMIDERDRLRNQILALDWSTDKETGSDAAMKEAQLLLRRLADQRDTAKRQAGNVDINYDQKASQIDRSGVRGLAMNLLTLDSTHYDKATALEVASSGKLKNIVVDDFHTGSELLKPGVLRTRHQIIPLDRVQGRSMDNRKLNEARAMSNDKARLAISLVRYDPAIANAMKFIFGDTLICDDTDTAKQVTFSHLRVRSVTVAGDVYDPSGTLSGGAAPSNSGQLVRIQAWHQAEHELHEAQENYKRLEAAAARNAGPREQWHNLTRQLEMKEHEVGLLEKQVGGSSASRIGTQIEELKTTISDLKLAIQASKDKQTATQAECVKLERDMEEFKNNKDGKIDELKASINKQKKELQKHAVILKTRQKELQTATAELESMDSETESAQTKLEAAKDGILELQAELDELNTQVTKTEAQHAQAETKLREERATLIRFDNELEHLEGVIKKKKQDISDADLALDKLERAKTTLAKDKTAAINLVKHLEETHTWILEDQADFGKPGTPYDFATQNVEQLRTKQQELRDKLKGEKKHVNVKVMNMIDSVEKKDASLKKMLATVMKDKEKIEETIAELDLFKREALQKTWDKVNTDFGEIFRDLLPGNFAKLEPPEGADLMDGLEVKVQLGRVWKQSLTELSGGQRSLIALSLIMSLLQFKPAPMYILDEIDAALDLSHTQNIGQLFRTRFKGSQFIVVSLKDGLFSNANVLFRTKFRDGTSIVEKTVQRSGSALYS